MATNRNNGDEHKVVVPHNREAEEAVIGSVLIDGELFYKLSDILVSDDFYIIRHRWMWEAFENLMRSKTPIDYLTTVDMLEHMPTSRKGMPEQNRLEEMGGPAYITGLINLPVQVTNAEAYARIVEAEAVRRKIISKANDAVKLAYDETKAIDNVVEDVDSIWRDRPAPSKTTVVSAVDAAELLRTSINDGRPMAVSSGYSEIDTMSGGVPRKAVSMLIGDASAGKTAFLLEACECLAFAGKTALYITLEEPVERIVARRVFSQANTTRVAWRNNTLTADDKQNLNNTIDKYQFSHGYLYLDDKARTIRQIERSVRQVRPDLLVVDDLRHVRLDKGGDKFSDTGLLIETMTRLKDIAIDEDCAIQVIHHMTADEAQKLWPGQNQKKRDKNYPPDLDSITWSKDLRYTVDVWQALVLDYQAILTAEAVRMVWWLMKDKEAARMQQVEFIYDKVEQWFYSGKPGSAPQATLSRINRIPAQKTGAMPSNKPIP